MSTLDFSQLQSNIDFTPSSEELQKQSAAMECSPEGGQQEEVYEENVAGEAEAEQEPMEADDDDQGAALVQEDSNGHGATTAKDAPSGSDENFELSEDGNGSAKGDDDDDDDDASVYTESSESVKVPFVACLTSSGRSRPRALPRPDKPQRYSRPPSLIAGR